MSRFRLFKYTDMQHPDIKTSKPPIYHDIHCYKIYLPTFIQYAYIDNLLICNTHYYANKYSTRGKIKKKAHLSKTTVLARNQTICSF